MRLTWASLHDVYLHSLRSLAFKRNFDLVQRTRPELQGFAEPLALIDHLHDRCGDPDTKDRILAGLVTTAQGGGPVHETAVIVLWLALWPGLDALYRRLLRHFFTEPDELLSQIACRLTAEIHRLNLSRVNRIAATILMNIERDIRSGLRKQWAEANRQQELPDDSDGRAQAMSTARTNHPRSVLDLPAGVDADAATTMIRKLLATMIGNDADLVFAVTIGGEGQREAASRFGLSHTAGRKRYQRAIGRLRMFFEEYL